MRVLFIGNSYTYFHDMPHTFARMCEQLTGQTPEVTMLAYSNRSLAWHREEYFSLRFALLYGQYDYCILQQQAHPFPDEELTRRSVLRILSLCRSADVKPVLLMTWAEQPYPEHFYPMQKLYTALSAETGAMLAPIGALFDELQRTHPEIELYWHDGEHASVYGDYLIAATLAAMLCSKTELSALDDQAIDFDLDFEGEDGMPLAKECAADCVVMLEAEKAEALRAAVSRRLGGAVHD